MLEVIDRARRGSEVNHEIHVVRQEDIVRNIVLDGFVALFPRQMLDVRRAPSQKVVDSDHPMSLGQKAVCEMRTEKTSAASDD